MLAVSPCCWAVLGWVAGNFKVQSDIATRQRDDFYTEACKYFAGKIHTFKQIQITCEGAGCTDTNIPREEYSCLFLFPCFTMHLCCMMSCCILPQRNPISSLPNSSTREPRTRPAPWQRSADNHLISGHRWKVQCDLRRVMCRYDETDAASEAGPSHKWFIRTIKSWVFLGNLMLCPAMPVDEISRNFHNIQRRP